MIKTGKKFGTIIILASREKYWLIDWVQKEVMSYSQTANSTPA